MNAFSIDVDLDELFTTYEFDACVRRLLEDDNVPTQGDISTLDDAIFELKKAVIELQKVVMQCLVNQNQ